MLVDNFREKDPNVVKYKANYKLRNAERRNTENLCGTEKAVTC